MEGPNGRFSSLGGRQLPIGYTTCYDYRLTKKVPKDQVRFCTLGRDFRSILPLK